MSILKIPFKGAQTFYIDPLFDIRLGHYNTENLTKGASLVSLLFPAATESNDSIISSVSVDSKFYNYLSENIGDCGKLINEEQINPDQNILFWGWDEFSSDFADKNHLRFSYPSVDIISKVNCREFCFLFNKKTQTGIPESNYCTNNKELESVLINYQGKSIVIKPDYGSAGYGFIRSTDGVLSKEDRGAINSLFKKKHGIIIEPWLNRMADISSGFILSEKGKILKQWHHQTLCNYAGTFFANYVIKDDPLINKYKSTLEEAISSMAKELHSVGYFGPVGFDSFEYETEGGETKFAPAIEINARMNIGMIARSILNKVSFDKPSFFRFISRKRHKLPDNYKEFKDKLGDLTYDFQKQKGVILITPLRVDYGNGPMRTPRSALTVTADTVEELWAMDEELRLRLR